MSPFIETIRIEQGQICNLAGHNLRMNTTRRNVLGCKEELDLAASIHPETYTNRTRCRVTYLDRIENVAYYPYQIRPVNTLKLIVCDTVEYSYKSSDRRILDELFSQRGEQDDILIVKNGLLTDTSICNIALWDGMRWVTPAVPLLAGTTRARLLEDKTIVPATIRPEELTGYLAVRLFNAMIGFGEVELAVTDNTERVYFAQNNLS